MGGQGVWAAAETRRRMHLLLMVGKLLPRNQPGPRRQLCHEEVAATSPTGKDQAATMATS